MSRQNIKSLPRPADRYADALNMKKGAYVVKNVEKPDVILLASGSEVATLFEAANLLEDKKNLKVKIVSVPSEGVYFTQSESYRSTVIDYNIPIFGLTAGLPMTLQRIAGLKGRVFGLDHFGHSAPYNVLDEKFGFTAENIYNQVCDYLANY